MFSGTLYLSRLVSGHCLNRTSRSTSLTFSLRSLRGITIRSPQSISARCAILSKVVRWQHGWEEQRRMERKLDVDSAPELAHRVPEIGVADDVTGQQDKRVRLDQPASVDFAHRISERVARARGQSSHRGPRSVLPPRRASMGMGMGLYKGTGSKSEGGG